jgi:hypothetical protein
MTPTKVAANSAPYQLEFRIDGLPKMANHLLRGHWRVKHAHAVKWKRAVKTALLFHVKPAQPLTSAALQLTRHSSAEPDFDGLVSGFKAVIDSLVECGVIKSDKPSCVKSEYLWRKGRPGKGYITVRVEEV